MENRKRGEERRGSVINERGTEPSRESREKTFTSRL